MNFLKHLLLFLTLAVLVSATFSCGEDDEMEVEIYLPLLRLSQTALQFELSECSSVDGETFVPAEVLVENAEQGELEQISYQISYDGSTSDWLDVNYYNRLLTIIPLAEAVDHLLVGVYTAIVKVSSSNAINGYEEIYVLLEVVATTGGNVEVVLHLGNAPNAGVNVAWAYTLTTSLSSGLQSVVIADLAPLINIQDNHIVWLPCLGKGNYGFEFFINGCNTSTSGSSFDLTSGETRRIDVYIDC